MYCIASYANAHNGVLNGTEQLIYCSLLHFIASCLLYACFQCTLSIILDGSLIIMWRVLRYGMVRFVTFNSLHTVLSVFLLLLLLLSFLYEMNYESPNNDVTTMYSRLLCFRYIQTTTTMKAVTSQQSYIKWWATLQGMKISRRLGTRSSNRLLGEPVMDSCDRFRLRISNVNIFPKQYCRNIHISSTLTTDDMSYSRTNGTLVGSIITSIQRV